MASSIRARSLLVSLVLGLGVGWGDSSSEGIAPGAIESNRPSLNAAIPFVSFDALADYHQLSFGASLGSGVSGLFPGLDIGLYPESYYRLVGSLGLGLSNRRAGPSVKVELDWNDPNARMTVGDAFSTTKKIFLLSPVSRTGALFSTDGKIQANLALGRLDAQWRLADDAAFFVEAGNRVRFDFGREIFLRENAGVQTGFRSPFFDLVLGGTRLGTTFDLLDGEIAAWQSAAAIAPPMWTDASSRYAAALDARVRIPLSASRSDRLELRVSGARFFHTWADAGRRAESVTSTLVVRVRSTAVGTSTYPPLINLKSKILVQLKDGTTIVYADLTSAGILRGSALTVTSPVINDGTSLNGRNDKNSFQGLGDTYLQPEETTRGAADYSKGSIRFEVPLAQEGRYRLGDIRRIDLQFLLRYNYQVEISLDGFTWKTVLDSRDVNAGFADIGGYNTTHQSLIADYPQGQDLDRNLQLRINPAWFRLIESKNLGRAELALELGAFHLNGTAAVNQTSNLIQATPTTTMYRGETGFRFPGGGVKFAGAMMDLGWETRFDGFAVHDFASPWFHGFIDRKVRSGLYAPFQAVEDHDGPLEAEDRGPLAAGRDDDLQVMVPGRLRPAVRRASFATLSLRSGARIDIDENHNGIPDDEENDIDPDYGIHAGEKVASIFAAWSNACLTLEARGRAVARDYETSKFSGYGIDTNGFVGTEVTLTAPLANARAFSGELRLSFDPVPNEVHLLHFASAFEVARDGVPDHLFLQRNIREASEAQIERFDALEAYDRSRLRLAAADELHIARWLDVSQTAKFDLGIYRPSAEAVDLIRSLAPPANEFFFAESARGASNRLARSVALYTPDVALRMVPQLNHGIEIGHRFNFPYPAASAVAHRAFFGFLASADTEWQGWTNVGDRFCTDFDAGLYFGAETARAAKASSSATARIEVRGRYTKDWRPERIWEGKALLISSTLTARTGATEWFAGLQWSVIDYLKDNRGDRINEGGVLLEDLSAFQLMVSARIRL